SGPAEKSYVFERKGGRLDGRTPCEVEDCPTRDVPLVPSLSWDRHPRIRTRLHRRVVRAIARAVVPVGLRRSLVRVGWGIGVGVRIGVGPVERCADERSANKNPSIEAAAIETATVEVAPIERGVTLEVPARSVGREPLSACEPMPAAVRAGSVAE